MRARERERVNVPAYRACGLGPGLPHVRAAIAFAPSRRPRRAARSRPLRVRWASTDRPLCSICRGGSHGRRQARDGSGTARRLDSRRCPRSGLWGGGAHGCTWAGFGLSGFNPLQDERCRFPLLSIATGSTTNSGF